MNTPLSPLDVLFDVAAGSEAPLPAPLAELYGRLAFPVPADRPWVIGNFVSTLDGVVAFDDPKSSGGAEISGHNRHDRAIMGLLRAVAGAVVVGAGTLRDEPRHIWTAEHIYRDLAPAFRDVRKRMNLAPAPLNVFVTARGEIDLSLPVFASGEVPVLIVTTQAGASRLLRQPTLARVRIAAVGDGDAVTAQGVLDAIAVVQPARIILNEGGPRLMADFFAEGKLDELFLTIAPQVAGRATGVDRPAFVAGRLLAPQHPTWGKLVSVRRAEHHLLLRYAFEQQRPV